MGEGEYVEGSKKARHRKKQLYNSILQLMEFYFSDSNLAKDRFLSQCISESPYVELNIFLKFNKIRKLNCDIEDIRKAISKSDLIELSENRDKVKRKLPIKVNQNVDNCTVYVENIKADANHEWLSHIFSEFGNVVYVSIPKYKHNKTNRGFAFIEFEDEEGAKNTLTYFESIGCKMPSETSPENLKSIQTFEEKSGQNDIEMETNKLGDDDSGQNEKGSTPKKLNTEEKATKRKLSEDDNEASKKIKLDTEIELKEDENQTIEMEETESKKKKKHKKDKKKSMIKELGLQVLSKPEWKKMRNRYLDLQKKKMKEFKQYLNRQRFAQKSYDKKKTYSETLQTKEDIKEDATQKLEFIPGIIVKISLPEPAVDLKKIKNDIKAVSSDIKYVDIPLPAGSEDIFVRFSNNKSAKEFCSKDSMGEKAILQGDEEQIYWDKIQSDRCVKFSKNVKKQRGRDKLLKKAEKERAKHIKFDEGE